MGKEYMTTASMGDEDAKVSGYAYRPKDDHESPYLEEHFHIIDAHASGGYPKDQGRWYLMLERSEWLSDDLEALEKRLAGFVAYEGYSQTDHAACGLPPATVKCCTAWGCEPRLIEGKEYTLVSSCFRNGEGHYTVKDENGKFEAPDVFFGMAF